MRFLNVYLKENEEKFSLENLDAFHSLSKKVQYTKSKLKKIGEGSSRIVFDLEDGYVLKLAKNTKGIEQNSIENDPELQKTNLVPVVKNSHKEDIFLISEKASPIKEKYFENISKINFKDFSEALKLNKKLDDGKIQEIPEKYKDVLENDFYQDVYNLMTNFDFSPGDLGRISSWGSLKNKLVLLDSGLTEDIYKNHYRKQK